MLLLFSFKIPYTNIDIHLSEPYTLTRRYPYISNHKHIIAACPLTRCDVIRYPATIYTVLHHVHLQDVMTSVHQQQYTHFSTMHNYKTRRQPYSSNNKHLLAPCTYKTISILEVPSFEAATEGLHGSTYLALLTLTQSKTYIC